MSKQENSSNNHAEMVLKQLKLQLDKEQLCDVVLISGIDGKRVPAHRFMLSANSAFFSTMFMSSMRESNEDEVTLGEVTNDVLQVLVSYCYTGQLEVHDDNVETLLATAHRWQMDAAVTACGDFLALKLDPSNCLGISFLAEQHNCTTLMEHAVDFINKHFVDVSQSQEFLQLNADQVGKLLCSDDLQVPNEEKVFWSLMSWVQHDETARKRHIAKLMTNVRLPLLQPSFIADYVEKLCIANDCQNMFLEAYKCQLIWPERLLSLARKKTTASNDCVLAIDRSFGNLVIESYCPTQKQWTVVGKQDVQRTDYGAACIENNLILVGGFVGNRCVKTMISMDLKSLTWTQLQSMSTPRGYVGVTVLKGLLYVVGGWNGSRLNTVERWNPGTGSWNFLAPMPTARDSVAVAVLKDCLYVIGGYGGREYLSCVERYDPCTNMWSRLSPMNAARSNCRVAQANGLLYAVGGWVGREVSHYVECYNPDIDKWTILCSMGDNHHRRRCALFDHRIVAAGGTDFYDTISTVKKYDAWNNRASWNKPLSPVSLIVMPKNFIWPEANP